MSRTFVLLLCGSFIWSTWALMNAIDEAQCIAQSKKEIGNYIKSDTWQLLFPRHYKFEVTEHGNLIKRNRGLKLNAIIHNSIYGCSHEENNEVDFCPNVNLGRFKSCRHGKNLKAAMFRSARCSFVEMSIKHLILSNYLLLKFSVNDQLEQVYSAIDEPIRSFGGSVLQMLSILLYGEVSGLGELMSLNLYLNNTHGTVLFYKLPTEIVHNITDFENARTYMKTIHTKILGELQTFWGVWCDRYDPEAKYLEKYENQTFEVIQQKIFSNVARADEFVRGLDVKNSRDDLVIEPRLMALTDFIDNISGHRALPYELLVKLKLNAFEATFEFDPQAMRMYHKSVFEILYASLYWSTITHMKLGMRMINEIETPDSKYNKLDFLVNFAQYMKPLYKYDQDMSQAVIGLPQNVSKNLTRSFYFLLVFYNDSKVIGKSHLTAPETKAEIQDIVKSLMIDMNKLLNYEMPFVDVDKLSYEEARKLMRSNYHSFFKLVVSASGFKTYRENLIRLNQCFFYSTEEFVFNLQ
ncbi:uncharacterized protein LOC126906331 isoform X2 [Daktulosphaira vitifoliae]|nr:uncharacterized protein LOC126906331 isoform X2 [Daktulosphaira vitifoliae]XP_050542844.1 uncharacterized protein LOC126906331 isoform X2 [Daktulosphaira vitifoliae]XP_050542845.1 uncharacterized protein LOC126906331 isoform X2 [Daktulosphaira vitifoliae]